MLLGTAETLLAGGEDKGYFAYHAGIHRFESCHEKTLSWWLSGSKHPNVPLSPVPRLMDCNY